MSKFREWISNIIITRRIKILFILCILFIGIFAAINISGIIQINKQIKQINEKYLNSLINTSELTKSIYSMIIENNTNINSTGSWIEMQRNEGRYVEEINNHLFLCEQSIVTIEQAEILSKIKDELALYTSINREIISLIKNDQDSVAQIIKSVKISAVSSNFKTLTTELMTQNTIGIEKNFNIINKLQKTVLFKIYITIGLIVIFLILLFNLLFKDLKQLLSELKNSLSVLANGDIPRLNFSKSDNELSELLSLSQQISNNLEQIRDFSNEIGKGNYKTDFILVNDNDQIAKALVTLRDNLLIAEKEEQKRKQEDEQRNWTTQGLAKFGDILRQNIDNISQLADYIIKNIVYYTKANQGGLFVYNDNNKEEPFLELLAAFAYDRKKYLQRRIKIGDGLVGMCALEKATIYLKDIPDNYIEIESGLGDSNPRSLLIVPLKTESKILGVVEIASFNEFAPFEIQFVENLAASIASTLATVKINLRTAELLEESQKKSEELAKQEQELRITMQEMKITQEQSLRREAEMSSILTAIDQTLLKIELDTKGNILSANQRYLNVLGYHIEEVKNRDLRSLFLEEYVEEFNMAWSKIITGQSYRITFKQRSRNGREVWLLNQFTPVFDALRNVVKVLYLANDITEQKLTEEKNQKLLDESLGKTQELIKAQSLMAENEIEMKSILTAIDQTLMKAEYSREGNLLTANRRHIDTMGYNFEEAKGKNIAMFIPKDELDDFMKLWQSVCEGNLHQITVKRKSKLTGKDIWLLNQYTPVKDHKDNVLKVLYMAIDITKQKEIEENAQLQTAELKQQEEMIRQNMEELSRKQIELEEKLIKYQTFENLLNSNTETSLTKKIGNWLDSI